MTPDARQLKARMLVHQAQLWVGAREVGQNRGWPVEMFQREVSRAAAQPWCLSFAMWLIARVDDLGGILAPALPAMAARSRLPRTEHCMTLWNQAPVDLRLAAPEPGCLAVWQMYDAAGKPTASGHVGVVVELLPGKDGAPLMFQKVEGNTGAPAGEVEREGDGVYVKPRSAAGTRAMRIRGYLRAW